jgi:hypothetical protein
VIERAKLITFKGNQNFNLPDSCGNDTWEYKENGSPGNWCGVTLDASGHVTELNLSGFGLSGTLSDKIKGFENLTKLDLSKNYLTDISALENFDETLDISLNAIAGEDGQVFAPEFEFAGFDEDGTKFKFDETGIFRIYCKDKTTGNFIKLDDSKEIQNVENDIPTIRKSHECLVTNYLVDLKVAEVITDSNDDVIYEGIATEKEILAERVDDAIEVRYHTGDANWATVEDEKSFSGKVYFSKNFTLNNFPVAGDVSGKTFLDSESEDISGKEIDILLQDAGNHTLTGEYYLNDYPVGSVNVNVIFNNSIPDTERTVLQNIANLAADDSKIKTGDGTSCQAWNFSSDNTKGTEKNWCGVTVDYVEDANANHVTQLNLSEFGLKDNLTGVNFTNLTKLNKVDISFNELPGNFPKDNFPADTKFNLDGNSFTNLTGLGLKDFSDAEIDSNKQTLPCSLESNYEVVDGLINLTCTSTESFSGTTTYNIYDGKILIKENLIDLNGIDLSSSASSPKITVTKVNEYDSGQTVESAASNEITISILPSTERAVLEAFYNATGGDDWDLDTTNCVEWKDGDEFRPMFTEENWCGITI